MAMKSYIIILALCLFVVPLHAEAEPFTYEFVTGQLSGTWTTDAPNTDLGYWTTTSWAITSPNGLIWNSTNPEQTYHEKTNYGDGLYLQPEMRHNLDTFLYIDIDGPTKQNLTQLTGGYFFSAGWAGQCCLKGTGTWSLVQPVQTQAQSVPIPGTFWFMALGVGLIVLFVSVAEQRLKVKR